MKNTITKINLLSLFAISVLTSNAYADPSLEGSLKFKSECYAHFSPNGGAAFAIIDRINNAKSELLIQAYNYASLDIADAAIAAHRRGVKVTLLIDGKQPTANGNQLQYSKDNGVPVFLDKKHAISHNKVMIIDGQWVHTGSFNFSSNAEKRNAENSIWCTSEKDSMAKIFIANFNNHLSHAIQF